MKILFIAYNYPSRIYPARGVFVKKLVDEFLSLGIEVKVIAPQSFGTYYIKNLVNKMSKLWQLLKKESDSSYVYRPLCFSFSNFKIGHFYFSQYFFDSAVKRVLTNKLRTFKPDVVYAHFIRPAGITAIKIAETNNLKSFIAVGEGDFDNITEFIFSNFVDKVTGIISVSEINKIRLLERTNLSPTQIIVSPNASSNLIFFQRNKTEMREKLGFSIHDFILIFVGYFDERKGANRVLEACEGLNQNIKLIFVGHGPQKPNTNNPRILFCNIVENSHLPEYLNCADVFILPTLYEGSCNAITEAISCGLPIISSNIPEVSVQVRANAILVNPRNIQEIRNAINQLFNNPELREKMSEDSTALANSYTITDRAKNILNFIREKSI